MSQVMEHIRELAEVIGPRPATTDAEAQAADYIEDVFRARALDVERQEFDCPRTRTWVFVAHHALTLGAAVLSLWWGLPALALAALSAVGLWLELDTRSGLSRVMPKGPSQNIIARHVPRARRGERMMRVVVVAHYDTIKPSLATSPGMVRHTRLFGELTRWTTVLTPVVIAFGLLPFAQGWKPWTGYAAIVAAAYLLWPLLLGVHRELLMHATDGANDNASGVAAMLGVMEATVPVPDESAAARRPVRRDAEAAHDADVVVPDALLEYREVPGGPDAGQTMPLEGFGDVAWDTGPLETARPAVVPEAAPAPVPDAGESLIPVEDDALWEEPAEREPRPARTEEWRAEVPAPSWDEEEIEGQEHLDFEREPIDDADEEPGPRVDAKGIRDWLGIGRGFDVRKAGKEIGSWDNLDAEDEDEFGFKAGTAGGTGPMPTADGPALDEIARIRRRVTESVDRALAEKEIWFVATGAKEAGGWGMRALLDAYPDELRDALIINVDTVGAGAVAYVTEEGEIRRYRADRRLVSQLKRTARERGLAPKGRSYRGMSTDATQALARRFRAMSVMAFDINGRHPDWHWHTDTIDNVSDATVDQAVTLVTALIRDL